MTEIPTYENWMRDTAGAFYERRNDFLRALDQAIKNYHSRGKQAVDRASVGKALSLYVEDHQRRKREDSWKHSVRNQNGAVERLMLAFVSGPVPEVPEPPKTPPPTPPEPPLPSAACPLARKMIDELKLEFGRMQSTPRRDILSPHETNLEVALTSLSVDLTKLYVQVRTALERTRNNYLEAMTAGFNTFENLHTGDAEDIAFKLSIASKVFESMKALPFPLSTIGKLGSGIVDLANVETFHGQQNVINVRLPQPTGLMKSITEAADKFKDFRTINVAPAKLSNLSTTKVEFLRCFTDFEKELERAWEKETESINNHDKRRAFARKMTDDYLAILRISGEMHVRVKSLRSEIQSRGEAIAARFHAFTDLYKIDHTEVGIWITVSIISDYAVSGLCGIKPGESVTRLSARELASKRFGDKFAKFLASPDVGILDIKTGERKSAAIYADGKIPWAGHPTHIIAVLLYLDWMNRNLNPFDLFRKSSTVDDFKNQSKDYIRRLGLVIEAHRETHWFGHNTVSDAAIARMAS